MNQANEIADAMAAEHKPSSFARHTLFLPVVLI